MKQQNPREPELRCETGNPAQLENRNEKGFLKTIKEPIIIAMAFDFNVLDITNLQLRVHNYYEHDPTY